MEIEIDRGEMYYCSVWGFGVVVVEVLVREVMNLSFYISL